MIVALALLQLAAAAASPQGGVRQDSLPVVTLGEALRRAAELEPGYVTALSQVGDAEWGRRAARLAFLVPSVSAQASDTRFSTEFFNVGTGQLASRIVNGRLEGAYTVFDGGSKFAELRRSGAALEGAHAGEVEARFQMALLTESDYYDVLLQRELRRVSRERVRRAEEQLAVARARVLSGAAVQTDSLQLLLELTRAQVEFLQQESALKVSRLQLGRRVGAEGPVDAATLDTLPAPELPITEEEAVDEAVTLSPRVLGARADERAADASVMAARGAYLPRLDVFGQINSYDEKFFPSATTRSLVGFQVTVPIWNNGLRELELSRAQTTRDAARAVRRDTERGLGRDVIEAYENYNTARASADLAARAVLVARENLRVQQERYRAGATTIIDLITAQVSMAEAEAELVQARHGTRLALAGLEAILGRRLFPQRYSE